MDGVRVAGGGERTRRLSGLFSMFHRPILTPMTFGAMIAVSVSGAYAEQIKSEPLKQFILDLIYSPDSSGNIDISNIDCLNIMDPAEGAGLKQCRHNESGIGFLLVSEPNEQSVSVSFLYSSPNTSDLNAISENGDPLVDEPADFGRWHSEILAAQQQLQESGLAKCAIEASDSVPDSDSRVLFGIRNPESDSRILLLFAASDGRSPAEFDWPSLQEGDILATLLVLNQQETLCKVLN